MLPYRSLLFVPGHKETWVAKATTAGADAVILDLEDSVPGAAKPVARDSVSRSVERLRLDATTGVVVRVNDLATPHIGKDLAAVVRPGLDAVLVPKVYEPSDLIALDALLRHFENEAGLAVGSVAVIPSLETAGSLVNVEALARGPRVTSLMAAAAKDTDIAREVGFRWSAEGRETLYLRSRVVLAARAAGLDHVVLGLWQDIGDLEGLRRFATANRDLGFGGQVLIHPSHVSVVNEVYGYTPGELARFEALIAAHHAAARDCNGAVLFEGEHIDLAHVEYARRVLSNQRRGALEPRPTQETSER